MLGAAPQPNVAVDPVVAVGVGYDIGMTYSGAALYIKYRSGRTELHIVPLDVTLAATKLPSLVYIPQQGPTDPKECPFSQCRVGRTATDVQFGGNGGRVYELFKRNLGSGWYDDETGFHVTATYLTAALIAAIHARVQTQLAKLQVEADHVFSAFSYPASWVGGQLPAFNDAIVKAGVTNYTVITEPLATAIAIADDAIDGDHALQHLRLENACLLVCDLGGGTLDFALAQLTINLPIDVLAAQEGAGDVGMSNIDKALALFAMVKRGYLTSQQAQDVVVGGQISGQPLDDAWRLAEDVMRQNPYVDQRWFRPLRSRCEVTKESICRAWPNTTPTVWRINDPNGQEVPIYRKDIEPILQGMNDAVSSATRNYLETLDRDLHITREQITHVLISGGGSQLPSIQATLQALFTRSRPAFVEITPANNTITPTNVVTSLAQRGAARYALQPQTIDACVSNETYGFSIWDQTVPTYPLNVYGLSTRVIDGQLHYLRYKHFMTKHKPVPLRAQPTSSHYTYVPTYPGQPIAIPVIRGEDADPQSSKNTHRGDLTIPAPTDIQAAINVTVNLWLGPDGLVHGQAISSDGNVSEDMAKDIQIPWNTNADL